MKRVWVVALVAIPALVWAQSIRYRPPAVVQTEEAPAPSCGTLCDDLVAYWNLDETSGTRADSVGENDLTDNNTVGSDTGMNNKAASFVAGNSEYLNDVSNPLAGATDMSYSLWMYPNATTEGAPFFLGGASHVSPFLDGYFTDGAGTFRSYVRQSDGTNVWAEQAISGGAWHHLLVTYTSSDKKLRSYLDGGAAVVSNALSGDANFDFTVGDDGLRIGAQDFFGSPLGFFGGLIDEVAIWSRVLTADERSSLYASGSGIFYDGSVFADLFLPAPYRNAFNDNWFLFRPKRPPLGLRALRKAS